MLLPSIEPDTKAYFTRTLFSPGMTLMSVSMPRSLSAMNVDIHSLEKDLVKVGQA